MLHKIAWITQAQNTLSSLSGETLAEFFFLSLGGGRPGGGGGVVRLLFFQMNILSSSPHILANSAEVKAEFIPQR